MKKIRVGIIGFGLSGRVFHASLLKAHPGYEVKMVSSSRTQEVKEVFPLADVVTDPQQIISHPELDLVINCAPNNFHYSYSAAALENGKHVVVEKPFVNTVADGEQLINLACQKNKVLTVFHNRRWDSDFLTIKKLIATRRLGEIKQFESHMDRWRPTVRAERWREQPTEGSGLLYDLGPHLIDQALVLFGQPERLMADIQCQKETGVTDDYFHVILYYGKMRVILHSSSFTSTTSRFQIFGDRGGFTKYSMDPQEEQLRQGLSPLAPDFEFEDEKYFGTLTIPTSAEVIPSEKGLYLNFYSELHAAMTSNGKPPVSASEALQTMKLIAVAHQSSHEDKIIKV